MIYQDKGRNKVVVIRRAHRNYILDCHGIAKRQLPQQPRDPPGRRSRNYTGQRANDILAIAALNIMSPSRSTGDIMHSLPSGDNSPRGRCFNYRVVSKVPRRDGQAHVTHREP